MLFCFISSVPAVLCPNLLFISIFCSSTELAGGELLISKTLNAAVSFAAVYIDTLNRNDFP